MRLSGFGFEFVSMHARPRGVPVLHEQSLVGWLIIDERILESLTPAGSEASSAPRNCRVTFAFAGPGSYGQSWTLFLCERYTPAERVLVCIDEGTVGICASMVMPEYRRLCFHAHYGELELLPQLAAFRPVTHDRRSIGH